MIKLDNPIIFALFCILLILSIILMLYGNFTASIIEKIVNNKKSIIKSKHFKSLIHIGYLMIATGILGIIVSIIYSYNLYKLYIILNYKLYMFIFFVLIYFILNVLLIFYGNSEFISINKDNILKNKDINIKKLAIISYILFTINFIFVFIIFYLYYNMEMVLH